MHHFALPQESLEVGRHGGRHLPVRAMAGPWIFDQAGVGDGGEQAVLVLAGEKGIVLAPHQQGRRGDAGKLAGVLPTRSSS